VPFTFYSYALLAYLQDESSAHQTLLGVVKVGGIHLVKPNRTFSTGGKSQNDTSQAAQASWAKYYYVINLHKPL
jgi:hypothetical protein